MAKGKELTTTISLEGKVSNSLKKAFAEAEKGAGKAGKAIDNSFGSKISGFASKAVTAGFAAAAAGITAASTAAVAASKAMFDLGSNFQSASNAIRIGTGATGEALDELNKSFDNVYKSVPTSMEAASRAISDWNTRLGITGESLETLSEQSILLSNMMGEDLTGVIESSSQAFKQWNINAENMDDEMDYIYKVCQSTGMGFNDLMGHMQSSGAVLQDLGYNFNEAASMIANLDKAGINTEQVLKGMKKGLGNIAKDGGDAVAAMNKYTDAIRSAKSESEAITIATDIFGSATAVTMAQAIRTGAMDVNALTAALQANDETIMKAAEDTETFPQKLQKLKATAEVSLRPVAEKFLDIANDAIPAISTAIEQVVPVISSSMDQIAPIMDNIASAVIPVISNGLQVIAPLVSDILTGATSGLSEITGLFDDFMPMIYSLAASVLPTISNVMNLFTSTYLPVLQAEFATITRIIGQFMPFIQQAAQTVIPVIQSAISSVVSIIGTLGEVVVNNVLPGVEMLAGAFANVYAAIMPIFQQVWGAIQQLIPVVTPFIQSVLQMLGNLFQNVLAPLASWLVNGFAAAIRAIGPIISGLLTFVMPVVTGIIKAFTGITDFLSNVFAGNWSKIWEGIKTTFTNIWNSLIGVVRSILTKIINGINKIINGINGLIGSLGGKALETIGISAKIPTIPLPQFATGGTVTSPTIAMIGEGGAPETVIPHTNTAESRRLLAVAATGVLGTGTTITGGSNDSRTFNITYSPVIQGAGLTEQNLRDDYENFRRFMDMYFADKERESFA